MRDNSAASSYAPMCQLASGIPLRPLQLYRARQPVEARHHQHVALVEMVQCAAQSGAVRPCAACCFTKDTCVWVELVV